MQGAARWSRINDEAVNDPRVQLLSPREFKSAFIGAIRGETTPFSRFIRPDSGRVFAAEWIEIRARIFQRDDYTCQYCGIRGGRLECDHVVPVSRGGQTVEENLKTACFSCNRSKRNKTLEEWK